MMVKQNQVHVLLVLTATFIHGVFSTQAPCPGGVATLNTEYTITGDRSNYTGFIWVRPGDGRYVVTCNPSCSPVAGYHASMNATHSTLTIDSVSLNDTGTWRILDAINDTSAPQGVCELMTSNISSTTGDTPTSIDISSTSGDTPTSSDSMSTTAVRPTSTGASLIDSMCPAGVLEAEYTITGDRRGYTGFIWVRPTDGRYVVTCNPSCSPVAGYSATINDTHSTLTIDSVVVKDIGTWKILDATVVGAIPVDVCHLTAATAPSSTTSPTSTAAPSPTTSLTSAAVPSPTTSPTSTAAPSPTTSPTSTGTSNTSPSSPKVSERSSTPSSPTTTESPPSDLTLGLAIGLPLLFCVIAFLIIALCFYRERLKRIGRYIVSGKPSPRKSRLAEIQCQEMRS